MQEINDNLVQAMQVEAEYRKLRTIEEQDAFGFEGKLAELGFDSFHDYHLSKAENYLAMNPVATVDINPLQVMDTVKEYLQKGQEMVMFVRPERPIVYVGADGFNEEYCENNNIDIQRVGYTGGTIVSTEDDIAIGFLLKNTDGLQGQAIHAKIKDWIDRNVAQSDELGNDICIDSYKVSGRGKLDLGEFSFYPFQVSFRVDLDLIKNISTKKMVKVPKSLTDFSEDADREDLVKEVKTWLTDIG